MNLWNTLHDPLVDKKADCYSCHFPQVFYVDRVIYLGRASPSNSSPTITYVFTSIHPGSFQIPYYDEKGNAETENITADNWSKTFKLASHGAFGLGFTVKNMDGVVTNAVASIAVNNEIEQTANYSFSDTDSFFVITYQYNNM